MAFPVDERVSCVVMHNNPLVSGKAISLHLLAVRGLGIAVEIYCSKWLVPNKLNADRTQQIHQNSPGGRLNGEQLRGGVTHRPPILPSRTDDTSGNPSYKGMSSMY